MTELTAGQAEGRTLAIRRARPEDAEPVVALCRRVLLEVYGPRHDSVERTLDLVGRLWLENPDHCDGIFVAEAGGRPVGTVQVWGHKVFNLYVERDHRARGVGRALLAQAEGELRRRGFRHTALDVVEDYDEVRGFYQALGWRTGRRHRHLDWGVPLVEMTKDLQPWPLAAARAFLWQAPKLFLLAAVVALLVPLAAPIVLVTQAAGNLGPSAVFVMTMLALLQWHWLDAAYLRTPARFGRALMAMAGSLVEMALAGYMAMVLTAALGFQPWDEGAGGAFTRLALPIAIILASRPLRDWIGWARSRRRVAPAV